MSNAISDRDLVSLVKKAIHVELENLLEISKFKDQFPIEDIGVAQGNSLSPLLGNMVLHDFDKIMNEGDCRCIRYIDDFIILAPSKKAANARLAKAKAILKSLGMELAEEKSSKDAKHVSEGFEFLGIEIVPGLVRPSRKAKLKFLQNFKSMLSESQKCMIGSKSGNAIDPRHALIPSLRRANGMIEGWGKHYWFCNDRIFLKSIDEILNNEIKVHLGVYSDVRKSIDSKLRQKLLGVHSLVDADATPFIYPKLADS